MHPSIHIQVEQSSTHLLDFKMMKRIYFNEKNETFLVPLREHKAQGISLIGSSIILLSMSI